MLKILKKKKKTLNNIEILEKKLGKSRKQKQKIDILEKVKKGQTSR